jgi:hypothetical protein
VVLGKLLKAGIDAIYFWRYWSVILATAAPIVRVEPLPFIAVSIS